MTAPDLWFDPLPLDDYAQAVQKAIPENIPKQNGCPQDYTVGGYTISCGPNVRFVASHEGTSDNYRGTLMFVIRNFRGNAGESDNVEVPKVDFVLGPSQKSVNEAKFYTTDPTRAEIFYEEKEFTFIRYSFEFVLQEYEQKVKYSLNGETFPHYQFYIPSSNKSMNVMSYSCNGFSYGIETESFKGSLWYDVMRRQGTSDLKYHVMVGGGDQLYADSIKEVSGEFAQWLKHKHIHSKEKLTPEMEASFDDYYLSSYLNWFGKGYWKGGAGQTVQVMLPVALASIPQINIFDDHDIIDGFGTYSDRTMRQEIFTGVGRHAFKYYMLFQQHCRYDESPNDEPSWILGAKKGPYITELSRSIFSKLGKSIGFLGLDCRTERTKKQIVSPETYNVVFKRLEKELQSSIDAGTPMKHLMVLLGVPILYPRMVFIEKIMESPLIEPILWLARKGIVAKGLVNEFDGEVELLDDLNDHWCAQHHKRERNAFIERLIKLGAKFDVRITILSGDVHLCCVSRFRSKDKQVLPENDPNFIVNFISSAIVNAPPPDGMAKFLSLRAKKHKFSSDAIEDMVPMFHIEPSKNNEKRSYNLIMNKRNYSDLIPISNLTDKQKERFSVSNQEKYFLPGPTSTKLKTTTPTKIAQEASETNGDIGYPFDPDGLVATLHVESDMTNTDSKTGDYELLIPTLHVKR
jgi:hypothetical protein